VHRREFIATLAAAVAAPLCAPRPARAQPGATKRIGVLYILPADDPEARARSVVFEKTLGELGWSVGQNLKIDTRLGGGDANRLSQYAEELAALRPDTILAVGSATVGPLQRATRTIPIVFVNVADPVGAGLVESLSRPGGNTTGFTNFEYSMSGKWVEVLRQIAPHVTRIVVLRDSRGAAGIGQFGAMRPAAQALGIELVPVGVGDAAEIERGIAAFATRTGNGGLIVTTGGTGFRRDLIIGLAARHKLPAVYPFSYYARDGGLLTYGPDTYDPIRRAASYVDRILKGEKPADLPVQAPTKYELVINLKTAKTLGLAVPPSLLALTDEVIE
jgi:putative ABC transport system substrate-binding protein